MKTIKLLSLIISFILVTCSYSYSKTSEHEALIINAVKKVKSSIVNINIHTHTGYPEEKEGVGSGIILTSDGYILTNTHVIKKAAEISVTLADGKKYKGKVIKASSQYDLAILKIETEKKLPVPKFGDSTRLELGQTAIAIGNPLHFKWTVTVGVISALGRDVKYNNIVYHDLIQTDAAINPGNSGGALVNTNGEVIGVNTLVYTGSSTSTRRAEGLSFAIPINSALEIAGQLVKTEKKAVLQPWIGITARDVTPDVSKSYNLPVKYGLLILSVTAESPARDAKLMQGDIITEINDNAVTGRSDFKKIINNLPPGTTINVSYWRGGKKYTTSVKVEQVRQ